MKIVLVNYRYFISGGPERYYFNIKEILEKNGHQVIPFSIKNSRNEETPYDDFFLDVVDDEVYFAKSRKSLPVILKSFTRMFYSFEAKDKFRALLLQEKPDLVYIMQYHNKISPSIIDAARSLSVPVVHRISDFQYMCPNALFYNDVIGVCEDCLKGSWTSCIKYKCVLNSPVYSALKFGAKKLHDMMKVKDKIDAFVVPSSFTLSKLKEYGIKESKLNHIPTFFNLKESDPQVEYSPFALFVGRIEKQKGLLTLIKTFVGTDYNLKIIGFSNNGYEDELKSYLEGKRHNIEFLGKMEFQQIVPYLKSCLFTVVPSEWYDNFPNVILESFAYKKAVVATDFGSLPELVKEGETGYLFKYADVEDFRQKVKLMFENPQKTEQMGTNAYDKISEEYSPSVHYEKLMALFDNISNEKNG
ncbi:MAG: glycosyltransferase family 4 protein [Bacteroidales bacterium]|jgi:glycosyltransferase involved in cell wall biosynthesis|nr:glycosyltransferase family 4 protein [Bacteroidales bacterium]